ncbi:hypothetical protein RB195_001324 [Necator americanus]|uniref:Uncharacterized protein n=1 Tax=Necator americanus TaxID=51031 RepID=A0ABR1DF38_NECAM
MKWTNAGSRRGSKKAAPSARPLPVNLRLNDFSDDELHLATRRSTGNSPDAPPQAERVGYSQLTVLIAELRRSSRLGRSTCAEVTRHYPAIIYVFVFTRCLPQPNSCSTYCVARVSPIL